MNRSISVRVRRPSSRRGVALVLVLWLVVILGGIGATVISGTRTSTALASNARARVVARYAAESGVEATVAEIEDTLASYQDPAARKDWLNALEMESRDRDSLSLGDARFAVAIVDPGARVDVNAAPVGNLTTLFSRFTDIGRASATAGAIRAHIERGDGSVPGSPITLTIRSLEELRSLAGVDQVALERAAPFLTVDGDGTINRSSASEPVLAAAFGEVRDEPSRLVIIARGWQSKHPLTHEIHATYAISLNSLVLVHWREQVR